MPPVHKPLRGTRVPDIRKGDEVLVLTGKDAGKKGTVQRVITNLQGWKKTTGKLGSGWQKASPLAGAAVVVEGLNIAKRHTKPRPRQGRTDRQPRIQQGGILEIARPLNASNVMIVCPACSQPTRVRHGAAADGRSVRVCTNCGEPLTHVERKKS
ncbi:MAG: large subunit ribosomal protein [Chloroflexota bacterium]|jgi:large subunit ribosomal protein L24|nr:large subunit ribosomal protein [Chloroflexota bacterium]